MADDKDTDPTAGDAVDGPDAAAPRTGRGPAERDSAADVTAAEAPDEVGYDEDGIDDADEDRELVSAGARSSADRAGTARSDSVASRVAGPQKKGRATPKQQAGADRTRRSTPAEFVRGSVAELKKVHYPSRSQLGNYFVVVLVFVLIIIAIVTGLDYGFGWLMLKVFG